MAKGVFISLYDESAYGIRLLSSCLKEAGHQRHIIFLKGYNVGVPTKKVRLYDDEVAWEGISPLGEPMVYAVCKDITPEEKEILTGLIGELSPDFIGMTVNTPLKWRINAVSAVIKKKYPDIPLIWGGFEATINPEESLNYCDFACRGESERTIVEIANTLDEGGSLERIKNICYKKNGRVKCNELNVPLKDLDQLPFQDCEGEGNYFIEDNNLRVSPRFLFPSDKVYSTITGRGCIFKCAYCCELYLKELYKPHAFLRRRSPKNVIAELSEVKKNNDIDYVIFQDEVFSHDMNWLGAFLPLYKREIGLPFTAYIFPTKNIGERISLLKDGGLSSTCLAVQSGSPDICELYNRFFNKELFLETASIIRSEGLSFYTDVITYNPLEKKDDLERTLEVLLELPQPYDVCINKLYTLPGTELHKKLPLFDISGEKEKMFRYYSALFLLASYFRCARYLIRIIKACGIFEKHPAFLRPLLCLNHFMGRTRLSFYKFLKIKRSGRLNASFILHFIRKRLQAR